jgi:ATP-dependent RNA helicase DeaD
MELPSVDLVNDQRQNRFKQRIRDALALEDLGPFQQLIEAFEREQNVPAIEIAAALARLLQGDTPLLLKPDPVRKSFDERPDRATRPERPVRHGEGERGPRGERSPSFERSERTPRPPAQIRDTNLETFRIEVGHAHRVKPGNIVGAIANEAGLESRHIGRIDIRDDHTFIDLPRGMPEDILQHLQNVWVAGQRLRVKRHVGDVPPAPKIKRGFAPNPRFDRQGPKPPHKRKPRAE